MGLIKPDRHDAFISYASRDDAAHGNLIKGIRDDLRERFRAQFIGIPNNDADFFIDQIGMPANGLPSHELRNEVNAAEFLFIFMGEHYLMSDFCGKELEWFRKCFRDDRDQALERTFVIVLEEKVKRLSWRDILEKPERPKFVELFDEEGKPLKRFLRAKEYTAVLNPAYETKLDWIVKTMIARAQQILNAKEVREFSRNDKLLDDRMEKLRKIQTRVTLNTWLEIERDIARRYVFGED